MNRDDLVKGRLRAADPAPGLDRISPDELATIFSLLEERRDAMTTRTPIRPHQPPVTPRPRLRSALAFGFALVVAVIAVGVAVLLIGGDNAEDVVTPTETTAPTRTTTPSPTTTPTTQPAEAELPVAPFETIIDQPLRNMEAIVGTDGYPVFLGVVETDSDTALRLIACTDPACLEEPGVVDIATGIEWQGTLALTTGPEGYPVIGYQSGYDPGGTTFLPYTATETPGRQIQTTLYCRDELCREYDSYELEHPAAFEALMVGNIDFSDGLPVFTYVLGPPNQTELHLVACEDPGCRSASDVAIDTAPFLRGSRFLHGSPILVDETGGVLVVYTASTPTGPPGAEGGWDEAPMESEVRVAYCTDTGCTDGPVVTTLGDGLLPLPIARINGSVHVKYVSTYGDEIFDSSLGLTSAECHDAACTSFTATVGAALPGTPGVWEDWAYDANGRLAWALTEEITEPGMVEGEAGPEPGEVPVGTRLAYSHCTDVTCSSITTIELGEIADADYWPDATVLFSDGEPMVAVNATGEESNGSLAGIRILRPLQR